MHLISAKDLTRKQIDDIFTTTNDFRSEFPRLDPYYQARGKVMILAMNEPSTRTRCSFEAAMYRLGGKVINAPFDETTSLAKGESVKDTIAVLSQYADVLVLRDKSSKLVRNAMKWSVCPVINAGDGAGEHPTQALLDLYTIEREFGSIEGRRICMVGDLRHSRTVHSLCYLLRHYKGIALYFVSPPCLDLPLEMYEYFMLHDVMCYSADSLEEVSLGKMDVIYMTRAQKERYTGCSLGESIVQEGSCITLTEEHMSLLPSTARVLSPLPRLDELPVELDNDPRSIYLTRQVQNGMYVRMGLLANIFNKKLSI